MSGLRRILFCLLFACALAPASARANPIVADISTYRIAIDAGFSGIRLFIFGARNDAGDVVVLIRGPARDFVVRKKERVAGIWVNKRQLVFKRIPDFYALASAKPLENIHADLLKRLLGIGDRMLLTSPADPHDKARFPEFSRAFLENQTRKRLYPEPLMLSFMGETLFKTVIPFPDNIPKGNYTAEIYLIRGGELVGMQAMPIIVEKTGIDAAIYDIAHNYPLLYGLLAIAIALAAGWGANRLFDNS